MFKDLASISKPLEESGQPDEVEISLTETSDQSYLTKMLPSIITNSTMLGRRRSKMKLRKPSGNIVVEPSLLPSTLKTNSIVQNQEEPVKPITCHHIEKAECPLQCSLDLIERFNSCNEFSQEPESLPSIEKEVKRNLKAAWKKSSIPPDAIELTDFGRSQRIQVEALHKDLRLKESEIQTLRRQIERRNQEASASDLSQSMRARIEQLEFEMRPLKADYERRTLLQRNLHLLFQMDEGDPNRSIENFYFMTVNKLTAFVIAVQALNSGLVARKTSWKDEVASRIFDFLGHAAYLAEGVGEISFGAGLAIPIIALPILSGAEFIWDKYREKQKEKEFDRASNYFMGGLDAIERQNQFIAYSLANLLHMQLRYCTLEGAQTIVDDWLYRLCYNLMKIENRSDEEADSIASLLSRINKSKEKKNSIKTYAPERKWNTLGLFKRAGVAYYYNGELCYESCYRLTKIEDKFNMIPITRADKYGYLFFSTPDEAIGYKLAMSKNVKSKLKKEIMSINWQKDENPLGPMFNEVDNLHLAVEVQLPDLKMNEDTSDDEILLKTADHTRAPTPEVEELSGKVRDLEAHNAELALRLQLFEVQMNLLMEKLHEINLNRN